MELSADDSELLKPRRALGGRLGMTSHGLAHSLEMAHSEIEEMIQGLPWQRYGVPRPRRIGVSYYVLTPAQATVIVRRQGLLMDVATALTLNEARH